MEVYYVCVIDAEQERLIKKTSASNILSCILRCLDCNIIFSFKVETILETSYSPVKYNNITTAL